MNRRFNLTGLLRLRHLQQDQAAAALGAANARGTQLNGRRESSRQELASTPSEVGDAAGLLAVAASRSAARGMFVEMELLRSANNAKVREAQTAFSAVKAQSIALEKLEAKHLTTVHARDLEAEQTDLDELASGSWHRNNAGVTA